MHLGIEDRLPHHPQARSHPHFAVGGCSRRQAEAKRGGQVGSRKEATTLEKERPTTTVVTSYGLSFPHPLSNQP